MLKLRIKGVGSLFFNLRSFHVESLLPRRGSRRDATASQRAGTAGRILSSPLEIPARLEVCKTLLLTGLASHF